MKVKAYILITTAAKETKETLMRLKASQLVQSAEAISGPHDIIAVVQGKDVDELGEIITQEIHSVTGVERTFTCIVMNL